MSSHTSLRSRVEAIVAMPPDSLGQVSHHKLKSIIRELLVYQIELEVQYRELQETQQELAATRDRYEELYNFSSVGYVSLDATSTIIKSNTTFADMVGQGAAELVGGKFAKHVHPPDQDAFYLYRLQVADNAFTEPCKIRIVGADRVYYVLLDCAVSKSGTDEVDELFVSMTDLHPCR